MFGARAIAGHNRDFMAGPDLSKVRVDHKSRTTADYPVSAERLSYRRIVAKILDDVCSRHSLSHAAIARRWDCSESYVRAVRAGDKPLQVEQLLALPTEQALAFLADLKAEVKNSAHADPVGPALAGCAVALGEAFAAHQLKDSDALAKAAARLTVCGAVLERAVRGPK